ncbi:MAG TPA: HAMP domain-containing sensor histidine kinase [Vicinamibacteria bacterium]|nr:HAMP domain-containing sensor histidine kinase [Vicinamibacteria bacterium]
MRVFSLSAGRRRTALGRIADGVLESPDLPSLTRLLTQDLPRAIEARDGTLLLWDRRLESFERLVLDEGGRLVALQPEVQGPGGPRTRWLLSEGQLLETAAGAQEGMLVPLLARSGLAGMLVLGPAPRRRRPVSDAEARLVSIIATRAALAVENHSYQKELIASERLAALGTMAGMMVHDLRGPMTLIRGWAETLLEEDVPPKEAAARARLIVDAVDRLERMASETLDFARGAEKLVLRSVPLGLLVAELAAGIEEELPGLVVERDFDVPGGLRGTLDVDKLRRAVSNVAANAREAMGGGGRLRFAARVLAGVDGSGERLELVLADDGPGVPPEIRDRVFEPFVTLGKKRGTGLGLAVARRFIEDHGGSLELLPPAAPPARGAAFRFALPLAAPHGGRRSAEGGPGR